MEILEAKKAVIDAGKKLVASGLIARTWGNVSCRVSDSHFVITPSGREYNSLTPEDIVLVSIADCTYDGDVKPSSEKGIHAACYRLRPDCGFVVHTHQLYASLAGLQAYDIPVSDKASAALLGEVIPAAAYGLPGTGTLRDGVTEAISRCDSKAALMLHHGAVCLGSDENNAFEIAQELEKVCKKTLLHRFMQKTGNTAESFSEISAYIAETLRKGAASGSVYPAYESLRGERTITMTPKDGGPSVTVYLKDGKPLNYCNKYPETAELHLAVYNARRDVNYIIQNDGDDVKAVSTVGKTLRPFLDDFAQIVGVSMRSAVYDPNNAHKSAKKVVRKLRGRNAVLLKDNGVLCVAGSKDDAQAVETVSEKGCQSFIAADLLDREKDTIKAYECALMRTVYKLKYSKQAKK